MADDFGDGWDEDLDDLIDDEYLGDPTSSSAPPDPIPPVQQAAEEDNEGWGDDDLNDLDVSAADERQTISQKIEPEQPTAITTNVNAAKTQNDSELQEADIGWEEDDIFCDANEDQAPPAPAQTPEAPSRQHQQAHKVEEVFHELIGYVESLMILLPSLNAVFEADFNNDPGKAHELLHYYTERPQLREYTIEKELARMDYQVIVEHEHAHEPIVIDNKNEIAQMFKLQPELDLLVRCANQSLLADLLHAMTGPDGLVRPQYMATCLAESCLFVIRCRPGVSGGLVECTSRLVLSLPESSGNRYPVANLQVQILLGVPTRPQQAPMLQFRLQTMDIIIPNMEVLRPTAHFLMESGLLDHPPMSPFPDSPGGGASDNDTFRDIFLQQSQSMLQNSTVGLKSAWKQIDSVAGFQSKMNLVKKILPTTNSSFLEAAMQEQEAFQQQLQSQAHKQPSTSDVVPVSNPGPPPQAQPPVPVPQSRPTSILGSFMGRLAKSVALPEEDPSIYEHYSGLQRSQSSDGSPFHHAAAFPRPPSNAEAPASAPIIHLYRTQESDSNIHSRPPEPSVQTPEPPPQPSQKTSPWLSRMTEPVAAPVIPQQGGSPVPAPEPGHKLSIESKVLEEEEDLDLTMDDGWGDDADLALDDDDVVGGAKDQQDEVAAKKIESVPADVRNQTGVAISSMKGVADNVIAVKAAAVVPEKYTKENDIIETRKRWISPRPGPRCLHPPLLSK